MQDLRNIPLWHTLFITSLALSFVVLGCEAEPTAMSDMSDLGGISVDDSSTSDAVGGEADASTAGPTQETTELGCAGPEDCDDGLACTVDTCDIVSGRCSWDLAETHCLIAGVCVDNEASAPFNACLRCDAVRSALTWSDAPQSTTCDDEDACTMDDVCNSGTCQGSRIDCDDESPCTLDSCDAEIGCTYDAFPNGVPCDDGDPCTTGERCMDGECGGSSAACDDDNPCTTDSCAPEDASCTFEPNIEPCDDGDLCTADDTCLDGACVGSIVQCDDTDVACLISQCDPAVGCIVATTPDQDCDDGDACTEGDLCDLEGGCAGVAVLCDDDNPCTNDSCDPEVGCVFIPAEGECDDGDPCTANALCEDGECALGSAVNCDDGDVCTIDLCDDTVGCVHLPTQNACCAGGSSSCDDGNPCTNAECDPVTGGCLFVPNTAACDDNNACTAGDTCSPDGCIGSDVSCDDNNPCTNDQCSPTEGCVHSPANGLSCDDGVACTTEDTCYDGQCIGDESGCACVPEFGDALKLTSMAIGSDESAGEAADLDGDGEGDNALSLLSLFANPEITSALEEGSINVLMDMMWSSDTTASIATYVGELEPGNSDCDVQTSPCEWVVDSALLDADTCAPIAAVPGSLSGMTLTAGAPDATFTLSVPLGDAELTLTIVNLMIEGELTLVDGNASAFEGLIGGAVPKSAIVGAIEAAPDDLFPVPKDLVLSLMENLDNDIDTTGDGALDGLSIGIKVSAIDAAIIGVF